METPTSTHVITCQPSSLGKPSINDTLDRKQKTFNTHSIDFMRQFRKALAIRYDHLLEIANGRFQVIWKDTDFDGTVVTRSDFSIKTRNASLPLTLAQTFVQVKEGDRHNVITVTLYFLKQRRKGGTCLIQGHRADKWATTEYEQLCDLANSLHRIEDDSSESLAPLLSFSHLALPDCTGQPTLPSQPFDVDHLSGEQSSNPSTPTGHASQLSDVATPRRTLTFSTPTTTLTTAELDPDAGGGAVCDLTDSVISEVYYTHPPPLLSLSSTAHGENNSYSPHPMAKADDIMSADTPSPAVGSSSSNVISEAEVTKAQLVSSNSPVSPLVPFHCAAALTSTRPLTGQCLSEDCYHQQQLVKAQSRITALEKEMASLRSCLAQITARLDKVDELARDNIVRMSNGFKAADEYLEEKLANVEKTSKSLRELKTKVDRLDSTRATLVRVVREVQEKVDTLSSSAPVYTSQATQVETTIGTQSTSSSPGTTAIGTEQGTAIPVTEHGTAIPVIISQLADGRTERPVKQRPVNGRHRRVRGPSPGQLLSTYSVSESTDTLIIGDSVLTYLQEDEMVMSQNENVQIITVSGLQTHDLLTWLQSQSVCSQVQQVTIHIGVNDCKSGEVTSRTWDQILDCCGRVFPLAGMQLSSIIPARGRLPINRSISLSNGNLLRVCRRRAVTFVDNESLFRSRRGAPRKALYSLRPKDFIHPSLQGVRALAWNINRARQPNNCTMTLTGHITRSASSHGTHVQLPGNNKLSPPCRAGLQAHDSRCSTSTGLFTPENNNFKDTNVEYRGHQRFTPLSTSSQYLGQYTPTYTSRRGPQYWLPPQAYYRQSGL